jgi:hypothetical protein
MIIEQKKKKLIHKGPEWSCHSVARVRRRNERPPDIIQVYMYMVWGNGQDKGFLFFISGKRE